MNIEGGWKVIMATGGGYKLQSLIQGCLDIGHRWSGLRSKASRLAVKKKNNDRKIQADECFRVLETF